MEATERQEEILDKLIRSYINLAEPISSELLKKSFKLSLSTATIRNEMQRLTELGYLYQPHTSAGRVPTDKGYRFFVDKLKERELTLDEKLLLDIRRVRKDYLTLLKETSRLLSDFSSGVAISYIFGTDFFVKTGWERIFDDPEFTDVARIRDFFKMVDSFEEEIDSFNLDCEEIQIYIGKEMPISKSEDFSLVISRCPLFEGREGILAILGPKRMAYDRNISLLDSVIKILNEDKI